MGKKDARIVKKFFSLINLKKQKEKLQNLKAGYLDSEKNNSYDLDQIFAVPHYLLKKKIIRVETSRVHGLVLTKDREVFGFGNKTLGRISGKIDLDNKLCIDIKVGEATNFVITEKNELYGWGYNKNFLLLNNDVLAEISPKKIVELGDIKVQQIAISKIQATVLSTEGQLYRWGCYLAREGRRILYKQVNLTQLSSSFFFEIESSWNSYH